MKKDLAIKVENVSKMYDLGQVGTGTLFKDFNRFLAKVQGKPDPYATIAELNDRTTKSKSNTVWALKDIDFEVEKGEVLGIIGRNGAGKSTLLKILSKITAPSTGIIKSKGRVASLLEVGTGMHPEMSAKDNIFLNGAIMGMTRPEIRNKLDDIVDFAGVTKYIDTPIKRFSSGMKVRLGFAVAAFLEPEILIVDEVLAVGDAEFQKRAVGKMQEVSQGGDRTVLFVSHNMESVKNLCSRAILLDKGSISDEGNVEKIVGKYTELSFGSTFFERKEKLNNPLYFKEIYLTDEYEKVSNEFSYKDKILVKVRIGINSEEVLEKANLFITLKNRYSTPVFSAEVKLNGDSYTLELNRNLLTRGKYYLQCFLHTPRVQRYDQVNEVCEFHIYDNDSPLSIHGEYHYGDVFGDYQWKIN